MPRVRKGTQLTLKEQGFVQELVKGKSIRKAIRKNYNTKSDKNANLIGGVMLKKPRIQYAILDLMDRQGVSDIRLVDKLKEHIFFATKEVLDKEGNKVEIKDNQTSIKALDMAMKIKGAYAPERHEVLGVNVNLYQGLSDEELNRRLEFISTREAIFAGGAREETGS
jgi:hypothetical protein